ncbi:DNA cytosine methyltransferase [Pseudescherichia vulneris]|uniref:DNA cytosine methyltransferase n=1 Tax=Pseudescherichia vulneris TaxID=566 RepID=UPI0028D06878|nr:DNA cytosine methyltransferase [Pseudescherichia vulneris]
MTKSVLSFFTGVGLLDMGFRSADFDIVWHNEINTDFITGFKHGHSKLYYVNPNEINLFEGSIETINKSLVRDSISSGLIDNSDFGIIGGPPCPDFSNAGKNLGKDGENGKLTGIFVDIISDFKPKFFTLENVKGLIQKSTHRKYLADLLYKLSKDYCFDIRVLNALDYGIPQDRERLFVIGFKKTFIFDKLGYASLIDIEKINLQLIIELKKIKITNLDSFNWYDWPVNPLYANAREKFNWPQRTPYGQNPTKPDSIPPNLLVQSSVFTPSIDDLANQKDVFKAYSDKFNIIDEGDISGKSFKRLHRWRFSPTAAYGNNEVHLHPYKPRRLSVREVMRIQSVPDKFELPNSMTLSSKFKTISNGVPVVLAKEIAQSISNFIE